MGLLTELRDAITGDSVTFVVDSVEGGMDGHIVGFLL